MIANALLRGAFHTHDEPLYSYYWSWYPLRCVKLNEFEGTDFFGPECSKNLILIASYDKAK
jgi:hypothetical protein